MNLKELLDTKGLVSGHFPDNVDDLVSGLKSRENQKEINLLYGETFDENGHPIDSLKYYLFLDLFSKKLEELDIKTNPIVLIADLGVYRNTPDEDKEEIKTFADKRYAFVTDVKKTYNCSFDVLFMSDLSKETHFKEKFNELKDTILSDRRLLRLIEKTVPQDKLEFERQRGYTYSLEELSVISEIDLKLGPPREDLYDGLFRVISQNFDRPTLFSVYLSQTYPLGLQFGEYLSSPAINKFGLTPYKAGSKGFVENRVLIGKTTKEEMSNLLEHTQISLSEKKPNPILDLAIIGELARQCLTDQYEPIELYDQFYNRQISSPDLVKFTNNTVIQYVMDVLGDSP